MINAGLYPKNLNECKSKQKELIEEVIQEEKLNEGWSSSKVPYSSKEAKDIMDNSLL